MFDTIILLTGTTEQPVLASALKAHHPGLNVLQVGEFSELLAIAPALLPRARLLAFATPIIVPPAILDALGFGAYNFHPGPPTYPGWAPSHFALYEGACEFGATAHVMLERIDAGPIVGVDLFPIPEGIAAVELEGLVYARLARLFWELARPLATDARPLAQLDISWNSRRNTRRGYEALCDIPLDIAPEELVRRIKVFGGNDFGVCPTIRLHGIPFRIAC